MSSNKMATKSDLQEMYSRILPYLGGSADAGFTPVGTIISVMGVTAPANYLACNGQVVNIADYPELANYFYQQFGSKNKFGGDGTTTFGIPDLRGEFLRGTGTNSHTNQGSGAAVGVHQDGTEHSNVYVYGDQGNIGAYTFSNSGSAFNVKTQNLDSTTRASTHYYNSRANGVFTSDIKNAALFTSRPTNTSVLYCIATKNIYMNPSLDYSTDEKVVGTWIDGSTIYQKSVEVICPVVTTDGTGVSGNSVEVAQNVDRVIKIDCMYNESAGTSVGSCLMMSNGGSMRKVNCSLENGLLKAFIYSQTIATNNKSHIVTLQYTKTT